MFDAYFLAAIRMSENTPMVWLPWYKNSFGLTPFSKNVCLFCDRRHDRLMGKVTEMFLCTEDWRSETSIIPFFRILNLIA